MLVVALKNARVVAQHRPPQRLGAGGVGQPEATTQPDFVQGLVPAALRFAVRRAHHEAAGSDPAKGLGDIAVVPAQPVAVLVLAELAEVAERQGFGCCGRGRGGQRLDPGGDRLARLGGFGRCRQDGLGFGLLIQHAIQFVTQMALQGLPKPDQIVVVVQAVGDRAVRVAGQGQELLQALPLLVLVQQVGIVEPDGRRRGAAIDPHPWPAFGVESLHGVPVFPLGAGQVGRAVRLAVLRRQRGAHPRPQHDHHQIAGARLDQALADRFLRGHACRQGQAVAGLVPGVTLHRQAVAEAALTAEFVDHLSSRLSLGQDIARRSQKDSVRSNQGFHSASCIENLRSTATNPTRPAQPGPIRPH